MGKGLVTLVNPNKIHPAITPYALDILTTSLEQNGYDVEVLDLTFRRDHWHKAVQDYFATRQPLLIGVTVRNTDTIYPQEQKVFLGEHKEIITEIRRCSEAPIVGGGVGFSSMPFAAVDYLGIDYGVKGPGEMIICQLADALLSGENPDVPGLLANRGAGRVDRVPVSGQAGSSLLDVAGYGESRAGRSTGSTPTSAAPGIG